MDQKIRYPRSGPRRWIRNEFLAPEDNWYLSITKILPDAKVTLLHRDRDRELIRHFTMLSKWSGPAWAGALPLPTPGA